MASAYAKKAALTAETQHTKYHLQDESDPLLSGQIKKYWTDLGLKFPGVTTAWSAVFVSWCIKTAGAKATEFKFSPAHSQFVHAAIKNEKNGTGVFRAKQINNYAPNIGDIIHNNRLGNTFDYAYAATHSSYSSHSAIVVETGVDSSGKYAVTSGGNESDSVRRKIVRLDANGFIKQRNVNPFICVIQNLK